MCNFEKDFNYLFKVAEEHYVDLGGTETQIYVMDFIYELCNEIEGLSFERATEGVIHAMDDMMIKPYQLGYMREDLEIFKYI